MIVEEDRKDFKAMVRGCLILILVFLGSAIILMSAAGAIVKWVIS